MTPGAASQPPDDVVSLSWNKQGTSCDEKKTTIFAAVL
jgi:hypothetical protein